MSSVLDAHTGMFLHHHGNETIFLIFVLVAISAYITNKIIIMEEIK